jgi:glycosyltransferase involved in cell wall biosynthesis
LYRKLTGKKSNEKFKAGYISEASSANWKSKLSVFIRGNFLIPDPRKFWIKPSVKYLSKYLRQHPVDAIVSTGPPHSMHLIALKLKKKFPDIKWLADFRDPWTDIDFYGKLRLTRWADKKHRIQEKEVLTNANHIITVSPGCAADLEHIAQRKVEVINNGFDHEDFVFSEPKIDDRFTISHFGAFNKDRNPLSLWKALGKIAQSNGDFKSDLKIQLIGQTDESVVESIFKNGLKRNLETINHLPHKQGIEKLRGSQVLLLPLNDAQNVKGILPGKMYEYLALQRPILAIGPTDADYAQIIKETKAGNCHNFTDTAGIGQTIVNYYEKFKSNNLMIQSKAFEKYSRKNLAGQIIHLAEN